MNGEPTASPQTLPTAVVIDDSRTIRTTLRLGLVQAGFQVVGEGGSGEEAIALYELHRPTLMFLDIVLPGLDGVGAATELMKRYPGAKIVMCSSLTSRDEIVACQKAGVAHFVLKPFKMDKIISVARSLLPPATTSAAGVAA